MSEIDRIVKLLSSDSMETQIAAAIVLGELRPKNAQAAKALVQLLDSPVPVVQQHAIGALGKIGAAERAVPRVFELLASSSAELRSAAAAAVASIGSAIVPTIRARQAVAGEEEKRALDAILAQLGGKDAFTTLLSGLASSTGEAAKAAALAVRQRVREATARERKGYLAATEKFLASNTQKSRARAKAKGGKTTEGATATSDADAESRASARAAAVKILGYLEDEAALPTLMRCAASSDEPTVVRREALLALRFVLASKAKTPAKLVDVLVEASGATDRILAQTALHTLAALPAAPGAAARLGKLLGHPDLERVRFVTEYLKQQGDAEATRELVRALGRVDRRRAEVVADALRGRDEAVGPLARALLDTEDADRSWLLRSVLRSCSKKVTPAVCRELLAAALERLGKSGRGWEALLDVARDADCASAVDGLRGLARKLAKGSDRDRELTVLELVCRCEGATDEDRYRLAVRSLPDKPALAGGSGSLARAALGRFEQLEGRGYDVGSALLKDKSLSLEQLYFLGFQLAEDKRPVGTELLEAVVSRGGRSKLAKMAKNKLALAGPKAP